MFTNEQVSKEVISLTKEMERYINIIESEVQAAEPNLRAIALASGKLSKTYSLITGFVGTFSGNDFRVGSFRESAWALSGKKEEEQNGN